MKAKYYILCLLTAVAAAGCSKDKGNYDYTEINEVAISGIKSDYMVNLNGELKITPELESSLTGDNLSYLWEIGGEAVATTRELNYQLPPTLSFGARLCRYTVTDEDTGMKFFQSFNLSVVSPFNWGYYMLTERPDGHTELAYLPVMTEERDPEDPLEVLHTDNITGVKIGDKPSRLSAKYGMVYGAINDYAWTIACITEEGEYPVIFTENRSFMPNTLINASSYADQNGNYDFKPETIFYNRGGESFFMSEGRVVPYISGLLYRPSQFQGEYQMTNPIWATTSAAGWFYTFDELSKKYYLVTPQEDVPEEGIIGDQYAYDKVSPIGGFPALTGHTVLVAPNEGQTSYPFENLTVATAGDDAIHLVSFSYHVGFDGNASTDPENPDYQRDPNGTKFDGMITLGNSAGADENSRGIFTGNDWYFSIGNRILTAPKLLVTDLTPFVEIPAEYGGITDMTISAAGKYIVVSTYNEASAEEYKGSLILVDMQTKEMVFHPNIMHRCVSILSCNADGFGWGDGDGN